MRYLVTIKAQADITRTIHVEASTEKEAGQSAFAAISAHDKLVPGSFEVTSMKEDPAYTPPTPRGGRVGRLL